MRKRFRVLFIFAIAIVCIVLYNASFLAPLPDGSLTIMSHRGVHQTFKTKGIGNDTCTAKVILPPKHNFLENTLPSMAEAISHGADMIELDIHPTSDGEFVVFHDWTLQCRTNGRGKTRDHKLAELKALDIGYGYSGDGGQTYPFRGQFIGAMPTLGEVLIAFPDIQFLINMKSRSSQEAQLLLEYLTARQVSPKRVVIYGHEKPISKIKTLTSDFTVFSKQSAKACFIHYGLLGWTGYLPKACRSTWVIVPENFRWAVWGWPNRFQSRLDKVGSEAVLTGPQTRSRSNPAIDSTEQLAHIPKNFAGTIWTNRIELIGPELTKPRLSSR